MEFDRLLGPDARVARCLASLFDPILYPRATRFVRLSQDEIGLLSAVSRQRANRALHALQRDGLLRIEHGGVEVLDLAGLRTYQSGAAEAAAAVAAATDTQAAAPLDDLVSPPSPRWP
ncbi:Crp-like helix-turn-helix domain protein [compost metagenome]